MRNRYARHLDRHWVLNENGDATGYAGTAAVPKEPQFECAPLPIQPGAFTETHGRH